MLAHRAAVFALPSLLIGLGGCTTVVAPGDDGGSSTGEVRPGDDGGESDGGATGSDAGPMDDAGPGADAETDAGDGADGAVDSGPGNADAGDGDVDGGDAALDGSADEGGAEAGYTYCRRDELTALDLLFVVDDSGSMREEQVALARELPHLVEVLASGDLDGDGSQDFTPVQDMHLGVVVTDMGASGNDGAPGQEAMRGYDSNGCASPGNDGLLQFPSACAGMSPDGNFLEFSAGDDPTLLGQNFACVSQVGTSGCGQEQQLDAMLKAVVHDPAYTFFGGSTGHGGAADASTANAGFLREQALLAVILVTDEDDCSLPDENSAVTSFSNSGTATVTDTATGLPLDVDLSTALNVRCGTYEAALHPIQRYVDGLRGLKPGHPERVVFGAIAGIPVDLEGTPTDAILADPSMQFVPSADPFVPSATPTPSCEYPNPNDATSPQTAYPPRRIVELAGEFGDAGVVRSICQDSFAGALDAIVERISENVTCVTLF